MKPSRPHMHTLIVSEPLLAFHDLRMQCGKVLETALIVYNFNTAFRTEVITANEKRCSYCRVAPNPPAAGEIPMYEYGLVEKKEWQAYLEARGQEQDEEEVA